MTSSESYIHYEKANGINNNHFRGYHKAGFKDGHGMIKYSDGTTYLGQWVDNRKEGCGEQMWSNGSYYMGEWRENQAVDPNGFDVAAPLQGLPWNLISEEWKGDSSYQADEMTGGEVRIGNWVDAWDDGGNIGCEFITHF